MPKPKRLRPPYRAMIVAPQPEAVEAGLGALEAGGNALDAVIACALTQGVVDPMMCGVGGLGSLHLFDPASGQNLVLDGLSTCPSACRPEMWTGIFERECSDGYGYVLKGGVNELGHAAVTTPGIMRVFGEAHAAFGKLPWAELFSPAIGFAQDGWVVRPHVAYMFQLNETAYGRRPMAEKLAFTEAGKQLYLRPDGTPKRVGDGVRNRDLAHTLRGLARDGAESFYTGDIGRSIAEEMRAHGGLLTFADLANFKIQKRAPLKIGYRGRLIAATPPPGGGILIAEMLRILERFELTALPHNGAEYIRVVAEAMKIAGRDKDRHIGDPDFVPAPLDKLLSDAYAEESAARIRRCEKTPLPRGTSDSKDTTTVSCIDRDGMVVSLTHTNGVPSGVIPPGTGFVLNGAMNWYDPRPGRAGSIAPGKRRFSSMTPTIVFEGEKPVMTLGAPGGAWIGIALLQVLLNVLDWGMSMQEAVAAPRFSATSDAIDISNRIPRSTQIALEAMGYEVRRSPLTFPFAAPHGITCWDGELEGGADPQRDGYAAGLA
ncbi:gamma-glutamyltransferase 1 Threonine peptidase. MEROPS family T03 [Rhizobiales bacterium GAS191]|nr:gamma-glutamyltransferase 1 Threonine peptidase. MEROPS family T03 [Rhizobiales bacterium GAS113]SEE51539.1 gamma-glutamyltransferase 1 Threonine peptidase. MEROPS family T03 [Rhizobiales bacterium GAS191]